MLGNRKLSLLLVLGLATHAVGNTAWYKIMFKGQGLTVTGTFSVYQPLTKLRCAAACTASTTCFVFSYDPSEFRCQVYTFLDDTATRTPAASTLETYGQIIDYFFENHPVSALVSWTTARDICQSRGAIMAYVETREQMKLMMQWIGFGGTTWVGVRRDNGGSIWYDVYDQVIPEPNYWAPAEPEYPLMWVSYSTGKGLVTRITDNRNFIVFCKSLP